MKVLGLSNSEQDRHISSLLHSHDSTVEQVDIEINGKSDKYCNREFQGNLEVYNRGLHRVSLGKAS